MKHTTIWCMLKLFWLPQNPVLPSIKNSWRDIIKQATIWRMLKLFFTPPGRQLNLQTLEVRSGHLSAI